MKYLVKWKIDQDKWIPILKTWTSMTAKQRADVGTGVRMIGRWHDVAAREGVLVLESNDLAAVQRYVGKWNPYMDIAVAPVLDDEESVPVCMGIIEDAQRA